MRFSLDGGSTWSSSVAYSASAQVTLPDVGDGSVTVEVQVIDAAGNSATASDSISLDRTAPTGSFTINGGASSTAASGVTLALTASDAGSGLSSMRFSNDGQTWSDWQSVSTSAGWDIVSGAGGVAGPGDKTVHVQWRDAAGNISSTASSVITYSPLPDDSATMTINDGATTTHNPVVTVDTTLAEGSPLTQMRLSNDAGTTWSDWQAIVTTVTWTLSSGDGTKTVTVQYQTDLSVSITHTDSILLDTKAPTASVAISVTICQRSGSNTLTIDTDEPSAGGANSGTVGYRMTWDATPSGTFTSELSWPASLSVSLPTATGTHHLNIQVADAAGNISATASVTVLIDETAPSGTVVITGGKSTTGITPMSGYSATTTSALDLSDITDTGCGGLGTGSSMSLSLNGTDWSTPVDVAQSASIDLTDATIGGVSSDGTKTVHVKMIDALGNQSILTATIVLDRATPTGSLQIDGGIATTLSRTVTLDLGGINGGGAGLWQMRFSNDGGTTWSPWQSVSTYVTWTLTSGNGTKTVGSQVVDRAGNLLSSAKTITLVSSNGDLSLTISPVVSFSGVPEVIDLGAGLGGDTVGPIVVTTLVTTNAANGYTLSITTSDLSQALGGTVIPASAFVMNSASPAAADTPLVVHTGTGPTVEAGEEVVVDISLHIPYVNEGAYSGSMTFSVETG
jgi:hypothetical protein